MIGWFYLALGFAVFSILGTKKRNVIAPQGLSRSLKRNIIDGIARPRSGRSNLNPEIARGSAALEDVSSAPGLLAMTGLLAAVLGMDWLLNTFLWQPAGRNEFRMVSLLLLVFLLGEGNEPVFVPLAGFSFWMIFHEKTLSFPIWLAAGALFPFATGVFRTLLEGCLKRLQLADVPSVFQGMPMTF